MTDRELMQRVLFNLEHTLPFIEDFGNKEDVSRQHKLIADLYARLAQPEPEPEPNPVGNTLTFMTRAIFNVIVKHQEINGGYFIPEGDVAVVVDRLAKTINSTFAPLSAPPRREWQSLTDEEIDKLAEAHLDFNWHEGVEEFARAIEVKLKEKNGNL